MKFIPWGKYQTFPDHSIELDMPWSICCYQIWVETIKPLLKFSLLSYQDGTCATSLFYSYNSVSEEKNMQNKNMWLLNMKIKMTVKISLLKFS